MASSTASGSAIHWFRKGLRLHDNPALLEACRRSSIVYPVFCMDPHFAKPDTVGVNRYSFLLESLRDLDSSLRVLGSQLYVLQGKPADLLPSYAKKWGVDLITFESDSEPYARTRDAQITHLLEEQGVAVREFCSHTIHSPEAYLAKGGGKAPSVYGSFGKLFASMGPVRADLPPPTDMFIAGMGAGDPAYNVPTLKGNPRCKQIPWQRDAHKLELWKMGRTGFPFIDAIMTQLRLEGWIHHLARHSTACFLTRGDLWQHWEEGAKVFDLYLLDGDWALNNANWQWLSASNFFYQYYRVYSPVAFGKKTDPNGDYIRMWIPQLANFPTKYIYEPWKAPRAVQEAAHCIVGQDYPMPMIDHDSARDENLASMKAAYAAQGGAEKVEDAPSKGQKRKATK
ncbi:FAD binding domain of DNA photolyase-domain-containing protein [Ochromonadaceae sp. CCMP2298]|nr:FAD binding domain of DNA photolyase-domain-containing protein [Ochromonadaceae sp. CCMP2298]